MKQSSVRRLHSCSPSSAADILNAVNDWRGCFCSSTLPFRVLWERHTGSNAQHKCFRTTELTLVGKSEGSKRCFSFGLFQQTWLHHPCLRNEGKSFPLPSFSELNVSGRQVRLGAFLSTFKWVFDWSVNVRFDFSTKNKMFFSFLSKKKKMDQYQHNVWSYQLGENKEVV